MEIIIHQDIVEIAYKRGLIIYSRRTRGGIEEDHFLVCLPLIITAEKVHSILSILKDSLEELA